MDFAPLSVQARPGWAADHISRMQPWGDLSGVFTWAGGGQSLVVVAQNQFVWEQ